MQSTIDPTQLSPEAAARVSYYSLISRIFAAPLDEQAQAQIASYAPQLEAVDQSLLQSLDDHGRALHRSMLKLCQQASTDLMSLEQQYRKLFAADLDQGGLSLQGGDYGTGFAGGSLLEQLRVWLQDMQVQLNDENTLREDHIALICEIMQHLIIDGDSEEDEEEAFATQNDFFTRFLGHWTNACLTKVEERGQGGFYAASARFARDFLNTENMMFEHF
jgi:TorA maturation chaperone TorD